MTPGSSIAKHRQADSHPFEPVVENRPPARSKGPFRVVAFNAQSGMRFEGILACLKSQVLSAASILLLCEVDIGTRRVRGRRVAAELASELGMSCAYIGERGLCAANGEIHSFLGNAILSREPIQDLSLIPLPNPHQHLRKLPLGLRRFRPVGRPVAMVGTVSLGGKPVRVCVAHLDSRCDPAGRELQMGALLEGFPSGGPAIIGGDLNSTTVELTRPTAALYVAREMILNPRRFRWPLPYEPLFRRLSDAGFDISGANAHGKSSFTFTRLIPPLFRPRLDWIALRGLEPLPGSAAVIPARPGFLSPRVSDHDFVLVDVRV